VKEHEWATWFEGKPCEREAIDSQRVEILYRVSLSLICGDRICSHDDDLVSRELCQNVCVDVIDIIIFAGQDSALCKIVIRLVALFYARIEGMDERIEIVTAVHVWRKSEGSILVRVLCRPNVQEVLGKSVTLWTAVQAHILMEKEKIDVLPQLGVLERSLQNLMPGTPGDHRQSLAKVTTKKNCDASKRPVSFSKDVPECTIKGLYVVFMLHGDLIPDDDACLL